MIASAARLALRRMVRYPAATALTFATLTIGFGVSATIFAVAWSIVFRPFPFRNQERLVALWTTDVKGEVPKLELSYEEVEQLQRESRTLEGIAAVSAANFPSVGKRRDTPTQLVGNIVGEPFFRILGVGAERGRAFRPADHRAGAPAVAVLTWKGWQERFGGDPAIVGERISVDSQTVEVVGILPRYFDLPGGADILYPLEPVMTDPGLRTNRVLSAIALMKSGASLEDVRREAAVISSHVRYSHPEARDDVTIVPYSLVDEILGSTRGAVEIMLAMGALVLLIALINAASIALAQGVTRADELAVRAAAGANGITRALQLFIEFLMMSAGAGVAGFLLANALLAVLLAVAPTTLPRIAEVAIGAETAAFLGAAILLSALVASLMQSIINREDDLLRWTRSGTRSKGSRAARKTLEILASAQIAVAVVTLVVAALLIQSFRRYADIDVGFNTDDVVTIHLPRGYTMSDAPEQHRAFFRDLLGRVRALEGVQAAGSVLMRPLEIEQGWDFEFTVEGQGPAQQERNPLGNLLSSTPGYLEAMSITPLAGRTFNDGDTPDSPKVAVIGESFARRYWGTATRAIGKRLKSGKVDSEKLWTTVIGVVPDVRSRSLTTEKLDIYIPHTQTMWSPNYLAIRTSGDPEAIVPAVRAIVARLDKELPVAAVRTSRELVDAKLAQPKLSAVVVAIFASTAGVLALIGLYGVLAFGVRQRISELGVRVALGANQRDLIALVVRRAAIVAIAGTVTGIAASLAADRLWRSIVFGSDSPDPLLVTALALVFGLLALMASVVPATRAARIDPSEALRAE